MQLFSQSAYMFSSLSTKKTCIYICLQSLCFKMNCVIKILAKMAVGSSGSKYRLKKDVFCVYIVENEMLVIRATICFLLITF